MAFSAAGFQNVGVGPVKLFIYSTTDTLTSGTVAAATYGLCSNNCPGLSAGDIVLIAHSGSSLSVIRMATVTATTSSHTAYAALA